MFPCFGLYTRIQKLLTLPRFASILDFFQYAFKDIILRANNSDVSVHFFHKSSCAIFIPLDELDRFYKIHFFCGVFVCFTISIMYFFCYCMVTLVIVCICVISP